MLGAKPLNGPAVGPGLTLPTGFTDGQMMPTGAGAPAMVFDPYHFGADATVDADGVADITLGPFGQLVLVDRIAIKNDGAGASVCTVYVGSADPKNAADYTPAGAADVADEVNPIRVPPNSALLIRWTGATAASTSSASVFYWQART